MTAADPEPRRRLGPGRIAAIVAAVLVNLVLVAAIVAIVVNPQRLVDQFAVWRYTPTATIAGYADRATMTDEGRFLFYASRPEIVADKAFDRVCSAEADQIGVLGCYLNADRTILLYDVTDPRLDGIEEVVASHELLHAAWDRLGAPDRKRIGDLLEAEAAKLTGDADFTKRMEFYAEAQPGQRLNELNSIIGTEVRDLAPELEQYYARYFADRSAVVGMHETSSAVFDQQQAAIADLVAQLDALTASIDADYAAYNAGFDQLNAEISGFNARVDAGEVRSQSEYDRAVIGFQNREAELNALYDSIQQRADQHASLVQQLKDLNAEVDELNASINVPARQSTTTG